MKITCENCQSVLTAYLCDVPSKWREQIVKSVCTALKDKYSLDCDDVKDCETLTSLSAFTQSDGEVCITFKDENGVSYERCFDISEAMNTVLDDVDPNCITDAETWASMSYTERIQSIVDFACNCE